MRIVATLCVVESSYLLSESPMEKAIFYSFKEIDAYLRGVELGRKNGISEVAQLLQNFLNSDK